MPSGRRVLVIECLGVASWLQALLWRWRFAQAYYVSEGWLLRRLHLSPLMVRMAGLTPLRFEDFPGSYFDVQREATQHATDAFHAAHGRENPLRSLLRAYRGGDLLDVALRKALLLYYVLPRVKAWVLLEELRRGHGRVVFLPWDNLPFERCVAPPWRAAAAAAEIPWVARALSGLREILTRLAVLPALLLMVVGLAWRHGLRRATRGPEPWPVAFDIFSSGIAWHMPHTDEILYDGKDLTPQRILHVVRDRLTDEATRRHFETKGYPYVELGRIPIPARLFLRRMLGRALREALRRTSDLLFGPHSVQPYLVPVLAVLRSTMEHEAFFSQYRVGVFVARDEYSVESVVRTALIHDHGGRTVGFTHGDDTHPARSNQYIAMDYLCYPGAFHRDLLHRGNACRGEAVIIGAGVYGLDRVFRALQGNRLPEKYAHVVGKERIIGAFPSSFGTDFFLTREHARRFYRAILDIEDMYDDAFIIVKPKNREVDAADPEIQKLLRRSRGRIALEVELTSYDIIPLCDLVLCVAGSTIGIESLMVGRRVLYFDESEFKEHPYRRYDERLVARTADELLRNVKWVLDEGGYVRPEVLERIRSYHGLRFDGMVTERLRAVVRRALAETPLAAAPGNRA